MEKAINKLLANKPLTGDEAGRIMILDLLSAYKDLMDGGEGTGVLNDAEKTEIVSGLTSASDVQLFNDYKGVHDFLTTASAVYDSYAKTYEVYYWKLYHLLVITNYAEDENIFAAKSPVVMTKEQYGRFMLSGEPMLKVGIAVLQDSASAPVRIGKDGFYSADAPTWRRLYTANKLLENSGYVTEVIGGMKDMLAECYARRKALEMIGRFIKVPHVKILTTPIDEDKISLLNKLMTDIINNAGSVAEPLSSLLQPIDISVIEPEPVAVKKARRVLSFPFIKNNSEAFTAMLKREWRDDCRE